MRNKRARLIVSLSAGTLGWMADVAALLADLAAESEVLDELVAGLDDDQWRAATPAVGWTIADQIAHLGWTDEVAHLAATDAEAFTAAVAEMLDGSAASVDAAAADAAARPPAESAGVVAGRPASDSPPPSSPCRRGRSCRGSGRR